ncbi:AAA family ATPase [Methylophaga thiooxydans]|uniref:Putative ATPase, AAA family n=1 Tax=Methylophaga thiooxydans DMS010 TaxID=637616 RepID=C0N7R0_9GAMM|nr:MoxR family ATPase [Methylophaga thiooxydans]EEF79174.1 putative ATPase, AAA family [Methylophaga thiooxydans DMS010]
MAESQLLQTARDHALELENVVNKVVVGQQQAVRLILIALHARGHVLLEGGVGVGKTTLLRAFSKALGGVFGRIEGSVDLMPNDLLYSAWVNAEGKPVIDPGPLIAQGEETAVFFFNEINRARPQVQSLLLRAMAERSVDAFGEEYRFPHMVVFADRNAVEKEETFELSAAARDRFLFEINISRPTDDENRRKLIFDPAFHDVDALLSTISEPLLDYRDLNQLDREIQQSIFVSPEIENYVVRLWDASWEPHKLGIELEDIYVEDLVVAGASVRGMSSMVRAAKVAAWLEGRDHVLPDDVHTVLLPTMTHRVFLSPVYEGRREQIMPLFVRALRDHIATP